MFNERFIRRRIYLSKEKEHALRKQIIQSFDELRLAEDNTPEKIAELDAEQENPRTI